jgi:hypothetical protein
MKIISIESIYTIELKAKTQIEQRTKCALFIVIENVLKKFEGEVSQSLGKKVFILLLKANVNYS